MLNLPFSISKLLRQAGKRGFQFAFQCFSSDGLADVVVSARLNGLHNDRFFRFLSDHDERSGFEFLGGADAAKEFKARALGHVLVRKN